MATYIWVNIGSGNDLLPDGTKPLPAPILTNHQWDSVSNFTASVPATILYDELILVKLIPHLTGVDFFILLLLYHPTYTILLEATPLVIIKDTLLLTQEMTAVAQYFERPDLSCIGTETSAPIRHCIHRQCWCCNQPLTGYREAKGHWRLGRSREYRT